MLHSLCFTCLFFALSGCATTLEWSVSRSGEADRGAEFDRVTEVLQGRSVFVQMAEDSDRGRFVEARQDSTRWIREDGSLRVVPTSELRGVISQDRTASTHAGVAGGAVLSAALLARALQTVPEETATSPFDERDRNVARVGATVLAIAGAAGLISLGYLLGRSFERKAFVWFVP